MIYDDGDRLRVRNLALAVTTLAWVALLWTLRGGSGPHQGHHGLTTGDAAVNWFLMLAAMMTPVLIHPIQYVRGSGLARWRTRSTVLFVAGYTAVWMLAGVGMLSLSNALRNSEIPPYVRLAAIFAMAVAWQCSPAKQLCLNRCHALRELPAFGKAAVTSVLVFGAAQGVWCAASCWAWMLLPLLLTGGHLPAMAAAAILIFCERLDDPAPVGWRWRGLGKGRRIVTAQLRTGLSAMAS